MHGVKKSDITPEYLEKVKLNVEKYNKLNRHVLLAKKKRVYNVEMRNLCDEVLTINPEHYTVWNYRREMVLHALAQSQIDTASTEAKTADDSCEKQLADARIKVDKKALLHTELEATETALKRNPKSYCAFFHRKWVVGADIKDARESGRVTVVDLKDELKLCTKFHKSDARNFHCWDYRRFIVSQCDEVSVDSELDYTTSLIGKNFSNYSAWHYRSHLLEAKHLDDGSDAIGDGILQKELKFAMNAFYVSPNDQSAWLYHRWLIGAHSMSTDWLQQQFDTCAELMELEGADVILKWPLVCQLMVVYLMRKNAFEIPPGFDLALTCEKLATVDPKRAGYYAFLKRELARMLV